MPLHPKLEFVIIKLYGVDLIVIYSYANRPEHALLRIGFGAPEGTLDRRL